MKTTVHFTSNTKKWIVHLIVGIIALKLSLSMYAMYNTVYFNKWEAYISHLIVLAFFIHSLAVLPLLTIKRNIKKYLIITIIGVFVFSYTISWLEAIRSSEFILALDGSRLSPSYFFFQTEWIFGVLLAGLAVFIPLFLFSCIYHIFLMSKKQRKQLFSFKYIEGIANVLIVFSLLILILMGSISNINALDNLKTFSLFLGIFYLNVFAFTPKYLKDKSIIKYLPLVVLLFTVYFLGQISIHGFIFLETNNFITLFIPFLIVFLLSFTYAYIRLKLKANERLFDLKLNAKESELQLLKSQVNPHFLFNTLNTLYATALKENAPKTAESAAKLASLIRYMQNDISKEFIPLENEINYLKDYIIIQKLRLAIEPEIMTTFENDENDLISPGLFIPLVENAFKYGIHPTDKSTITISIVSKENQIAFSCENQYDDAIKIHQMNEGFGIGIENVKKRLELVYPKQHTFEVLKENDTFSVQLIIPTKHL